MSINRIILYGLLYVVCGTGILACKKEYSSDKISPCSGIDTSYITSEALRNSFYSIGSFWIFRDMLDNTMDTLSVTAHDTSFLERNCGEHLQAFYFIVNSSQTGDEMPFLVVGGGIFKDRDWSTSYGTSPKVFTGAFDTSRPGHFDSLLINGKYYYEVERTRIEIDYSENRNTSVYYWNESHGFLKHEIFIEDSLISRVGLDSAHLEIF